MNEGMNAREEENNGEKRRMILNSKIRYRRNKTKKKITKKITNPESDRRREACDAIRLEDVVDVEGER